MRDPGETRPFRGPTGEVVSGSLAEVAYLRLGGLDQWVMIRGKNVANLPLILLPGGPGLSEPRFFRLFNAPLERHLTVVYWDQRGAGKSVSPDIARSSMTVKQFVSDLDDLVEAGLREARQYEGRDLRALLGLGARSRLRRSLSREGRGYVGSGQYGDAAAGEAASYAYGLAGAERRGNRRALNKLRAIGPPPHTAK